MNLIQQHLSEISPEALREWRNNTFSPFASASGSFGRIQLGVNGNGKFAVKLKDEIFDFHSAEYAITCYTEFLTQPTLPLN